jgi:glucoamylase
MHTPENSAPGGGGCPARWTSSAKTGVGTALSNKSNVWFTLSHGIFNEIYYPRIDQACIRDMGLIVTDGASFFSEEKRDCDSKVHWLEEGVPAFRLVNTCRAGRYRIEKQIVSDPHRDSFSNMSILSRSKVIYPITISMFCWRRILGTTAEAILPG